MLENAVDAVIDAHAVERAPNEEDGNQNEDDAYPRSKLTEVLADGHLHSQQTEQGGELDDGVQWNWRSVLEGITHGIDDDLVFLVSREQINEIIQGKIVNVRFALNGTRMIDYKVENNRFSETLSQQLDILDGNENPIPGDIDRYLVPLQAITPWKVTDQTSSCWHQLFVKYFAFYPVCCNFVD